MRVQHVEFDAQWINRLRRDDVQRAADRIQVDAHRHGDQVPSDRRVIGRTPHQAAEGEHQFPLLRVAGRVGLHREEHAVRVADRLVDTLALGPLRPPDQPSLVRLLHARMVGQAQHRGLFVLAWRPGLRVRYLQSQLRLDVRVFVPAVQPSRHLARRYRHPDPIHPVDVSDLVTRLRRDVPVREMHRRMARHVPRPGDLVSVQRARCRDGGLLSSGEKLEQSHRAVDAARRGGVHNRGPFEAVAGAAQTWLAYIGRRPAGVTI
ncbi:hypothetical protein ACIBO1_23325 [Micromonospora sp. NPDC049903]|uniref:hypothetical protein n=1 Tax=Micromonospora sp. NPDC049903 TaxID=3364276 RepID=UPI003789D549